MKYAVYIKVDHKCVQSTLNIDLLFELFTILGYFGQQCNLLSSVETEFNVNKIDKQTACQA